ncbi:MAG: HAD family phosphatase [Akkermansiaceae bacterium]|nr:HAD family phosphatase [Akkermansiaceae bacterium]
MKTSISKALHDADAILFDFDGVILDSEWPIYQSWKRVFEREGCELPPDVYVKCIGSDFDTWSPPDYLQQLTGKSFDWDQENAARQVEIMRDLDGAAPMPGAGALIKALRNKRMAVVSSSSHNWVDGWLNQLGLMPYFHTTVCRGDAPRIKPAPDLYLEAARRLDAKPENCLVVEDSMNGLISAHAAGMGVLAVPNRLTQVLDFSRAEWIVPSLAEMVEHHTGHL